MRRVLYVDFENVSSAGLNGLQKLTDRDEVKIFLGPKCSKMSLIEAETILHDPKVELIKNDQIGKNALDFIIMVHLGYDIAKREGDAFFIISNDKGYDPAILEMRSRTGETVERCADIEQAVSRKEEKTGLFARLFGKKKPVVENTTEHEVISKKNRGGARNGNNPRSGAGHGNTARTGSNGTRGNSRNNSGNNRNAANSQNRNNAANQSAKKPAAANVKEAPKPAQKQAPKQAAPAAKQAQTQAPKQAQAQKPAPKPTPKPVVTPAVSLPDDSYLDNMSIADLRAQLSVTSTSATLKAVPQSGRSGSDSAPKPAQPKRPANSNKTEMTDAEKDLVNRALAETDNLGDFHNYILKELHDNDRATEIYKSEKYRVGKKTNNAI